MKLGYARISTAGQDTALQLDALKAAGCERIFEDTESGAKAGAERPGLAEALKFARPGDALVVWRLDRLGRSLPDLVKIVADLERQGTGFHSLQENIETHSAGGKLVFHIFAALAEFERNLIRERTKAGLAAARARGRKGGRKPTPPETIAAIQAIAKDRAQNPDAICKALGISRATFYKYVNGLGTVNSGQVLQNSVSRIQL